MSAVGSVSNAIDAHDQEVQMKIEAGLLSRLATERSGAAPALTYNHRTLSFSELNEAACRLGSGLLAAGLRRGDRVGVLGYNCAELAVTWLGLEKHNLVRAVLHSHIDLDAHVDSMNHIEAAALIFDTRMTDLIEAHRDEFVHTRVFVAIGHDAPEWATPFERLIAEGSPEEPFLDVDEDAPCFLQLTSGTTANPKPWVKTYRSWHAVVNHNMHHLDTFGPETPSVGPEDVNLHCHPLQWATGYLTFYPYLLRGARTVLVDEQYFDPEVVLETIASEGVTGTLLPASLLTPMLDVIAARGRYEHQLKRLIIVFGTPDILRRATDLLGPIWAHGFGSSEQGGVTTRLLPIELEGHPERIASIGRGGSPFFDLAILDPESQRRLGPGEIGEMVVRSPMSIGSYWGLEKATRDAYFDDDWFRPRDLGYVDEDGFVYYAGRAGEEIRLGDSIVYPHHVEAQILGHAAVRNCAVVGLGRDDALEVVAAVQLKDPASASGDLEVEILARCAGDMHRSPDRVVFVDELPAVLGGAKVQRKLLREQLQARVEV
jgi:acyl-coenzyme A synthetase/AMP-(fatty) acid ligase